jgi:hypothetical protein
LQFKVTRKEQGDTGGIIIQDMVEAIVQRKAIQVIVDIQAEVHTLHSIMEVPHVVSFLRAETITEKALTHQQDMVTVVGINLNQEEVLIM